MPPVQRRSDDHTDADAQRHPDAHVSHRDAESGAVAQVPSLERPHTSIGVRRIDPVVYENEPIPSGAISEKTPPAIRKLFVSA